MCFKKILILFLSTAAVVYGHGVEDAKGYHTHSDLQWAAAMKLLNTIDWKGEEKILDVGCGDGKITAFMAENFSKAAVVGIDISESMIRFASNQYNQERHRNLIFLIADAAQLPFEKQFDVAISLSALHWSVDQKSALKSLCQALVPGGKVYILTYGQAPMNLSTLSENLIYSEKWAPHFPAYSPQRVYFTPEIYLDLLHEAGFSEVNLLPKWSQTIYPHRQALTDFVSPLLNFIQHLSPELKRQFINQVVDQMIALSKPTEDGAIIFEVLQLEVAAIRP